MATICCDKSQAGFVPPSLTPVEYLGCDLGQGYFFSKPLGIDPLTTWLRELRWGFQSSRSS